MRLVWHKRLGSPPLTEGHAHNGRHVGLRPKHVDRYLQLRSCETREKHLHIAQDTHRYTVVCRANTCTYIYVPMFVKKQRPTRAA